MVISGKAQKGAKWGAVMRFSGTENDYALWTAAIRQNGRFRPFRNQQDYQSLKGLTGTSEQSFVMTMSTAYVVSYPAKI